MTSNGRNAHLLKRTKRVTMPENIVFVDVETNQEMNADGKQYHSLKLGVAIYCRNRLQKCKEQVDTFRFTTIAEFWDWVETKIMSKKILYMISHNAVFDFIVLKHITNLSRLGYECQFLYEGGVRFIAKWMKANHTIMILDNANWFAGKLASWGKELDLPKLEMPIDTASQERWFIYCERDCYILYQLYKWYTEFLLSNDLGSWKYTIASQAFTSFRHRFMNHKIYIPGDTQETEMARDSYHGGRTECFQIGEYNNETYYKVDVNSMYPYVMSHYMYPVNFDAYYESPDIPRLLSSIKTRCAIADVLLCTDIPFFVHKSVDRNIYPVGQFRTTLCTEEIRLAIENNWVKEIYSCIMYRARNIFTEYVDFFYGVKVKAGHTAQRLLRAFAKLYLNSLYGKFGQRGFSDRVIGQDKDDTIRVSHGYNVQTGQRYTIRQIGHQVMYSEKKGEGYNSFCAIASHVCANARLYLYSLVLIAGRKNCFYCDTDSIIVNETGLNKLSSLMDKTKLGFLKIEGVCNHINIVAPKHYFFEDHWTRKGVRKDAVELGPNHYRQMIWPGFNTILKSRQEEYFNFFMEKQLTPRIVSGVVDKEGSIRPFVVG